MITLKSVFVYGMKNVFIWNHVKVIDSPPDNVSKQIHFSNHNRHCICRYCQRHILAPVMSKTKQYFCDLLEEAISGQLADVVNFRALKEFLRASIDLQFDNYATKTYRTDSQRTGDSNHSSDVFYSAESCESFVSARSSNDGEFTSVHDENVIKKTTIIEEIDLATNAVTSSISTFDGARKFTLG